MLQAFGDESHDPKNERLFAVAAWFGAEEDWNEIGARWKARLGNRIFHAADCESDRGEFSGNAHGENLTLYADLTKILCDSRLLGFGSAMDLAGYREFFPDALEDIPYFRCFRDVIVRCGTWARMSIPEDTLQFVFDQRVESASWPRDACSLWISLSSQNIISLAHGTSQVHAARTLRHPLSDRSGQPDCCCNRIAEMRNLHKRLTGGPIVGVLLVT